MAVVDCIVKLGGSALTQKGQLETIRPDGLRSAAVIVKRLYAEGKSCIVVHGAGSFGHFQAKDYGVSKGIVGHSPAEMDHLRQGLCLTRLSVTKLNHLVTEQLVKEGVAAVGISPFGAWKMSGRQVVRAGFEAVKDSLISGYVPVLHGDCALDAGQHCCILSGDTIIEVLSKEFSPKQVVFLTDVDGIYDRPPNCPGAQLLNSITVSLSGHLEPVVTTSTLAHDVTGGAGLKIRTAVSIVTQSQGEVRVLICKLGSPGAEKACLQGEIGPGEGTRFVLAAS
ncbi:hypothetical protein NDU88_005665 [Pleurodeles waltl]|uniref:Isopentenyl phosphate kinase n=2 Tax=Pleurodeles waltl TaxID=8319 RepID=A0AAV7QGM1_PLEWA|nr:hypothetical protein NDU88_005665 [Pleurodeles waltl]